MICKDTNVKSNSLLSPTPLFHTYLLTNYKATALILPFHIISTSVSFTLNSFSLPALCPFLHSSYVKKKVKVLIAHSCVTLCHPLGPQGSSVHGILQARTLEWVAFPFSRDSSQPRDRTQVFCIAGGFFMNWDTREVPSLPIWACILDV